MKIKHVILVGAVAAGGLAACDSDPFQVRWNADADTAQLFALSRPELNLVSAFDFFSRTPLRLEAPTTGENWDVAVDFQDGGLAWLPQASLGVPSDAGIAILENETFLSASRAPGDTTRYVSDAPIPIRSGEIYVVRTRLVPGAFGTLCNYYGKVEALSLDPVAGEVTFQFDVSPVCNDRDLLPPN